MNWLHEPPVWHEADGTLEVTTGPDGDYWRTTHYGFVHDDGHFAYEVHDGDFTATVRLDAEFSGLYDQAGLMLRLSEVEWIKAGIEFFEGRLNFSVVVTHGYSDWSVRPWTGGNSVWVRMIRKGDAVAVQCSSDGESWELVRLAFFKPAVAVMVGPMTCSPTREGLVTRFIGFNVGAALGYEA